MEIKLYCLRCKEHWFTEDWEETYFRRQRSNIKAGQAECPKCGQRAKKPLSRRERAILRYGEPKEV